MPLARIQLTTWEIIIFAAYLLLTVAVAALLSAAKDEPTRAITPSGDNKLPVVRLLGTSMVASALSSDHFIAQVGAAYRHGFVIKLPSAGTPGSSTRS